LLIAFSTEEIRELCTVEACAVEKLGQIAAEVLKNRLADIDAAEFISDVLVGRPRRVLFADQDCYVIDLIDGLVLALLCNQVKPKMDAVGKVDWGRVRRVKVLSVGAQ
jgi:hypothetical protein